MGTSTKPDESPNALAAWLRRVASAGRPGAALPDAEDTQPTPTVVAGYRLLHWPALPDEMHVARILQALSVMSHRPATVAWFARRAGWTPGKAHEFLERLVAQGAAQALHRRDHEAPGRHQEGPTAPGS